MANTLGTLVVALGLDAAQFTSGLTKSEQLANRFAARLDGQIAKAIVKAEIALTALATAGQFAFRVLDTATKGAGDFKDLEESTGAVAEDIASLAVAAGTAGVEIVAVTDAANKLTKTLTGVDDESKAAGAALKAIGLNVAEFKRLDPVGQYEALAKAINRYGDGSGKTAVAVALMGQRGAEQLRVFKALEEQGGRTTILNQRQIELADEYADAQAKASAELRLYLQAAASQAVPALTDLTNVTTDLLKSFLGVDEATSGLARNNGAKEWAEDAVDAVVVLAEALYGIARLVRAVAGSFQAVGADIALMKDAAMSSTSDRWNAVVNGTGPLAEALARRNKVVEEANQRYIDLWTYDGRRFSKAIEQARMDRALSTIQNDPRELARRGRPVTGKPQIEFDGADSEASTRLRKSLDAQLREIRDFANEQRAAIEFANEIARATYEDGNQDLRAYYEAQAVIRDAGYKAQLTAIDREIAALEDYRKKASKPEERADAENKIAEASRKRAEIVAASTRSNVLATLEEARALEQLQRRYQDLKSSIAELSGDRRAVAAVRIERQTEDARRTVGQAGGDPNDVALYRSLLENTERLKEAQSDYTRLLERQRNEEESIRLAAEERGASEIETMQAVRASRAAALDQLSAMVDQANELALALGTPEAIAFAEQLGLAFKRASAEMDPILVKMKQIGQEAAANIVAPIEDAVIEGRNFNDTVDEIGKALLRLAIRELVTKPMQEALANAIGGNGQASGGGGWIGALGSAIGSYFGGGKAIGGPTMPNTLYQVGERRPEVFDDGSRQYLLTGSRRGRVYPNPVLGGSKSLSVTNNFVVGERVDRRTQNQIAAAGLRGAARVNARFN